MKVSGTDSDSRKLIQVLISAYACNPYQGSEEGVGWGWVQMISEIANPTVLVAAYHQEDIERYLTGNPDKMQNVSFHFVPHKLWHYHPTTIWRRIEGSILKPIMNLAYTLWLGDAYRLAKELHAEQPFELAHQLTYVGFRFPGCLWRLGIPFVWGPIGGLENMPWRFLPILGWRGAVYYAGRNLVNAMQRLFLRSVRKALWAAGDGVIAATSGINRELQRWYGRCGTVIAEVGPPVDIQGAPRNRELGEPLRLIWSGQHLPGKALPLLLRALPKLPKETDWQLIVLGGGPMTSAWRQEARGLGIESRCHWLGQLPREQALARMREGHLFVITSLKDLTSTVLLEAMALGLPVIAPNHCGFADVLTESSGILLPIASPTQFMTDLAHAIHTLTADELRRRRLAMGAIMRSREFDWSRKAQKLREIYERLLGQSLD